MKASVSDMGLRKDFKDVCVVNDACEIEYVHVFNPDFFGFKPDEVIGKSFLQIYANLDEANSTFVRAIRGGERFVNYVQVLENNEGRAVKQTEDIYLIRSGEKIMGAVEFADYDEEKDLVVPKRDGQIENLLNDDYATAENMIGECEAVAELKKKIQKIKDADSPVLIMGETGTGKELTAHIIHNSSARRKNPYVYVNCSALPENLLEGILFGIKKGSFTDAEEKTGLFQMAEKGTLFLDEVDSMPLGIQSKILRAIEEKCIRPIGGTQEIYLDVRIIASCNKQMNELLKSRSLRNDLLFRLSVIQFSLPPLRERRSDILQIADYYRKKYNQIYKKKITGFTKELQHHMLHYAWPGNVRELKNMMEGMYPVMKDNVIGEEHMRQRWLGTEMETSRPSEMHQEAVAFLAAGKKLKDYLEDYERQRMAEAWQESGEDYQAAAKILGISPQLMRYKMKKYFF